MFLIDENLSPRLAVFLRRLGYKTKAVREVKLKGKDDEAIVYWLQKHNAILITSDLDFGEIFYWKHLGSFGVIILRSKSQGLASYQNILKRLHKDAILKDRRLIKSLLVADDYTYRWRKFYE